MILLGQVAGWGVVVLLLFALGIRYGMDAFAAGVGLTLVGGLLADARRGGGSGA